MSVEIYEEPSSESDQFNLNLSSESGKKSLFWNIFSPYLVSKFGDPNTQIIPSVPRWPVEFHWQTDNAVDSGYIQEVQEIVKQLPEKREDLAKDKAYLISREDLEKKVDMYVAPYLYKESAERNGIPSLNPFYLCIPEGLHSADSWVRQQKKNFEYTHGDSRSHVGLDEIFIRLIKAWNTYHVEFLTALNIVDDGERKDRADGIGKEIFAGSSTIGFLNTRPIKEVSPYDDPTQWMVYHALNVLHSPRVEISPVARYRAIKLLTSYSTDKLEKAFLGKEDQDPSPFAGYWEDFSENLLRLPRSFWQIPEERTQPIHKYWEKNQIIQTILNPAASRQSGQTTYDYGRIFNTLVTQYPHEAVQVALLMLTKGLTSSSSGKAALEGLINFAKLDPISIQKIFGNKASYLRMHRMPTDTEDQIEYGLGIYAFDDEIDEEGLSKEQLLQVVRRNQTSIADLEERLAKTAGAFAKERFSGMSEVERRKIDPKGYFQLLGIDPFADPADVDELLKAAYKSLARKYHPDGSQPDEEKMKQINEAYGVLGDEEKRKGYRQK